ncbi:cytochrome oxidase [Natribaculum luteum]|uniref:Cytochrome oxidase n=1 Tax=Natribaculum luteum TaxID=1586232 RepID=A0ABD5NX19_9EURY|nr:cytochrome oxidase [Natribaculum luteum]
MPNSSIAVETTRERTLGHDEFDPIGTLALITLYFLILVVMWLFMYFVEFVGNGPTVVGVV